MLLILPCHTIVFQCGTVFLMDGLLFRVACCGTVLEYAHLPTERSDSLQHHHMLNHTTLNSSTSIKKQFHTEKNCVTRENEQHQEFYKQ